jgi:hypothetical protein
MANQADIWEWREIQVSDGTIDLTLVSPKIPSETIVKVETFGALIYESPARYIFLGIIKGNTIYWIKSSGTLASTQGVVLESPIYLMAGDQLVARVKNPAAGENFHVYASGIRLTG